MNSEETPDEKPDAKADETPVEKPEGTTDETSEAVSEDKAEGSTEGAAADKADESADKAAADKDDKSTSDETTDKSEATTEAAGKDDAKTAGQPDLKAGSRPEGSKSSFGIIAGATALVAAVLIIGILFATGVLGDDSTELSGDDVAKVSDVSGALGTITQEDFDRSFKQTWSGGGLKEAPKADDPQYQQVKDAALNDLLDKAWLTGEADALDISASDEEVQKEFDSIRKSQFKDDAAYEKFLKDSGFSEDDVLERVKLQVLSQKIEKSITADIKDPAEQQAAMTKFTTEYQKRWTERTTCAEDFINPRCGNAPEAGATGDTAAADEEASSEESASGSDETASVETGEIDDLDAKPPIEGSDDPAPENIETEDIVVGDGAEAKKGDQISVQYVGALYDDGTEFDASWDRGAQPFEFKLGSGAVIKGWDDGLVGMKEGGRRKLIIPAKDGYGAAGSPPSIPGDATLVFIVDMVEVK